MTDLALFVQLQARIATFLADQPVEQLVALAEGRATLSLVGAEGASATPPIASVAASPRTRRPTVANRTATMVDVDAEAIAKSLRAKETIDEATAELAGHKLTAVKLKLVAQALGVSPKGNKAEVTRQIINQAVGARLKYVGLRQG